MLVNRFFELAQEKSVARRTDRPAMTIAVDLGRKATKQTKIPNCNINTKKIVLNLNEALHFVLALATIFFIFVYVCRM